VLTVFQSDLATAWRSPVAGGWKAAAPALALVFGLAFATQGHATAYFLQSAAMDTSHTAHIYGPGGSDEYVYIAPIVFKANEGVAPGAPTVDLLSWCVDIFHNISLGEIDLKYDETYDLTTDSKYQSATPFSGGGTLTVDQIEHVGRLINYGTKVYDFGVMNAGWTNMLAGIQGAIWQVINGPAYSVVGDNADLNDYISIFTGSGYQAHLTGYGPVSANISMITETGLYGTFAAHQAFGFAIPEPGTWALMITGFGLAGAMLRRERRRALVRVRIRD
jgi:hypothetical protein